jgi:glycosyltransferase involved in cell wall biosynthesis
MKSIVVIPAYNEALTIASLVFLSLEHATEVIVVDDGSLDTTSKLARLAGAQVYSLSKNAGKAAALMKGLYEAIAQHPDVIIILDGDGQHNPYELPVLMKPILDDSADVVIGSRFLACEHQVPRHRRIGQIILDHTIPHHKMKFSDTQSGYRAFGPCAYPHLLTIRSHGYNIELDMIDVMQKTDLRIMEVPIHVRYDGLPNIHKKNPILHGLDLATSIFGFIGYQRPLLCFGLPGLVSLCIGILSGLITSDIYGATKEFAIGYALISVLLIISGLLLGMTALILNAIDVIIKKGMYNE